MRLQKIISAAAAALSAFAASVGLLEVGNYLYSARQPLKPIVSNIEPAPIAVYQPPVIKSEPPETLEDKKLADT